MPTATRYRAPIPKTGELYAGKDLYLYAGRAFVWRWRKATFRGGGSSSWIEIPASSVVLKGDERVDEVEVPPDVLRLIGIPALEWHALYRAWQANGSPLQRDRRIDGCVTFRFIDGTEGPFPWRGTDWGPVDLNGLAHASRSRMSSIIPEEQEAARAFYSDRC